MDEDLHPFVNLTVVCLCSKGSGAGLEYFILPPNFDALDCHASSSLFTLFFTSEFPQEANHLSCTFGVGFIRVWASREAKHAISFQFQVGSCVAWHLWQHELKTQHVESQSLVSLEAQVAPSHPGLVHMHWIRLVMGNVSFLKETATC